LNGDGDQDEVTANASTNDTSILLGDGSGGVTQTAQVAVGNSPRSLGLGDLNGDGAVDVVTANAFSNNVSILLGDGSGGVTQTAQVAVGNSPHALGLGDLNGDGAVDVVTANANSNDISILLGQRSTIFIRQPRVNVGRVPLAIAMSNFDDDNGDGKVDSTDFLDLVTANSEGNDISVVLSTRFLRNIMTDKEIVFVTIEGRATRAFQLTLQEPIPLGNDRSFFVRAFFPNSTIPAFEGRATANIPSSDIRVVVNLNRL
jgi:hypothetical protein